MFDGLTLADWFLLAAIGAGSLYVIVTVPWEKWFR